MEIKSRQTFFRIHIAQQLSKKTRRITWRTDLLICEGALKNTGSRVAR